MFSGKEKYKKISKVPKLFRRFLYLVIEKNETMKM